MKKRRIVQVGVGSMGRTWALRLRESKHWEAVAYVDVSPESLRAAQEACAVPAERCYTDLAKALREVEADALLDVTPQQYRKEVCTAAFERGLDVLCEKPLADSLRNAKTLVKRAEKAGVTLMVAQNYRYQSPAQTAKRFIRGGQPGEIGYVSIRFCKGPHFGGYREEMAYPLVLDMSIHHFDLIRGILGVDVAAVQATSVDAPWNWNKGDATVMAQLELSNGAVANYFGTWVAQGAETTWNGDWRFEGSEGVLLWEDDALSFSNRPDRRRKVPPVKWPLAHQACLLKEFAQALNEGRAPETSGRDNLNSLATTYAVVRSARERRRVSLNEMLA